MSSSKPTLKGAESIKTNNGNLNLALITPFKVNVKKGTSCDEAMPAMINTSNELETSFIRKDESPLSYMKRISAYRASSVILNKVDGNNANNAVVSVENRGQLWVINTSNQHIKPFTQIIYVSPALIPYREYQDLLDSNYKTTMPLLCMTTEAFTKKGFLLKNMIAKCFFTPEMKRMADLNSVKYSSKAEGDVFPLTAGVNTRREGSFYTKMSDALRLFARHVREDAPPVNGEEVDEDLEKLIAEATNLFIPSFIENYDRAMTQHTLRGLVLVGGAPRQKMTVVF